MLSLQFETTLSLKDRLISFIPIQESVFSAAVTVAPFTEVEAQTYERKQHSFYFAQDAMISIFTDLTERSPTFGLNPIDVIGTFPKRSWISMFTNGDSTEAAWLKFLGRPFKGLAKDVFEGPFTDIADPDLKRRALNSLKNAGPDQQALYDFSYSAANIKDHPIEEGDLGMLAVMPHEIKQLLDKSSVFLTYLEHITKSKARVVVLFLTYGETPKEVIEIVKGISPESLILEVPLIGLS